MGKNRPQPKKQIAPIWPALLIAAVGAVVYANGIANPLIFDDAALIALNPQIQSITNVSAIIHQPPGSPAANRPLSALSFALNYSANGTAPEGYRLANLSIHIGCALLLLGVLRHVLPPLLPAGARTPSAADAIATAVALIWLVHPINSEVVDYIAERTESLMGFCFLLTLYAHIRANAEPDQRRWPAIEIVACGAGMLCKETMVVAPVVVMLFDRTFAFASWREAWRKRGRTYAGLASTWALLVLVLLTLGRTSASGFATAQVSSWGYLMSQSAVIVQYLKLMIWPSQLVLNYGWAYETAFRAAWPYVAVLCALGAVTLWAVVQRPFLGFLGVWFFLTLAPASSVIPVATEVGAERRMYLPGMAVITLLVLSVVAIYASIGRRRGKTGGVNARNVLTAALIAIIALGCRTWQRNAEYSSAIHMAETVVSRRPTGMAEFMLGSELVAAKRTLEALPHLAQSAVSYPPARFNLGGALLATGRTNEAIDQLRQFIHDEPQLLAAQSARLLLGQALQARGDFLGAVAAFRELMATDPSRTEINALVAEAYALGNDFAAAVPFYRAFLARQPENPEAWTALGVALARSSRQQDATQAFKYAEELAPGNIEFCLNVARSLIAEGKRPEAREQLQKALRIDSKSETALQLLRSLVATPKTETI